MSAGTIGWSVTVGRGVLDGVLLLDTHAAILLVATLFARNLRRTSGRINEFNGRAVGLAVEAAEGATAAQIRRRRVVELRSPAGPLLDALVADGPPNDAEGRRRYATSEALLRDGVRGRSLMNPRIAEAATDTRDRGAEVTFLDDRGQGLPTGEAMARMTDVIVEYLEASVSGSVTIRLAPGGRRVAVSIVSSGDDALPRLELDDEGCVLAP